MAPTEKPARLAELANPFSGSMMSQSTGLNGCGEIGSRGGSAPSSPRAGGSGKGTLAAHLVACATNRKPWPDGSVSSPCQAVVVSPDDAVADTLKPRLLFSDVDFELCWRLNPKAGAIKYLPSYSEVGLIILDVVEAGMAFGRDGNAAGDVARHLSGLNRLAERLNAAVLVVHHLNKWVKTKVSEGSLANLVRGSGAWTDAVRMAWLLAADENDEKGSRVLVRAKSNIGGVAWGNGGYRITAKDVKYQGQNGRPGLTTVVDNVIPITGNAHAIFAAAVTRSDPAAPVKAGRKHAARDAILGFLKPGKPMLKSQVLAVLSENDHAGRTLERAAEGLQFEGKLIARKRRRDEFAHANNNSVVWESPEPPDLPEKQGGETGKADR